MMPRVRGPRDRVQPSWEDRSRVSSSDGGSQRAERNRNVWYDRVLWLPINSKAGIEFLFSEYFVKKKYLLQYFWIGNVKELEIFPRVKYIINYRFQNSIKLYYITKLQSKIYEINHFWESNRRKIVWIEVGSRNKKKKKTIREFATRTSGSPVETCQISANDRRVKRLTREREEGERDTLIERGWISVSFDGGWYA